MIEIDSKTNPHTTYYPFCRVAHWRPAHESGGFVACGVNDPLCTRRVLTPLPGIYHLEWEFGPSSDRNEQCKLEKFIRILELVYECGKSAKLEEIHKVLNTFNRR